MNWPCSWIIHECHTRTLMRHLGVSVSFPPAINSSMGSPCCVQATALSISGDGITLLETLLSRRCASFLLRLEGQFVIMKVKWGEEKKVAFFWSAAPSNLRTGMSDARGSAEEVVVREHHIKIKSPVSNDTLEGLANEWNSLLLTFFFFFIHRNRWMKSSVAISLRIGSHWKILRYEHICDSLRPGLGRGMDLVHGPGSHLPQQRRGAAALNNQITVH